MKGIDNKTCEYFLLPLPVSNTVAGNLVAYCVLDALLAVLIITGNGIFFATLIKTSSLHTPSNVLLGVMCTSDIAVGVFVQPTAFVRSVFILKGIKYSKISTIFSFTGSMCSGLSLIFTVLVSVDRYTAICHPFTYQRVVTCKRNAYAAAVASVLWLGLAFISLINVQIYWSCVASLTVLSITVVWISYTHIFRVILKKKRAVVTIQQVVNRFETSQQREARKQAKKSYTICIILILFMLCYLPYITSVLYFYFTGHWRDCSPSDTEFLVLLWMQYLLMVNSFINPMIYCFRLTDMRSATSRLIGLRQ